MPRRVVLNLVGLDLGGVVAHRKRYVWTQGSYCYRQRRSLVSAEPRVEAVSPSPVKSPGSLERPRVERVERGYLPSIEEIEEAKAALRPRYASERRKPG